MVSVVISLGSNWGDREATMRKALQWLHKILIETKESDIYPSECAKSTGREYLNAVISGIFQGTGFELEDLIKEKERELGRTSERRSLGQVPIDMDIVVCDGEIIKEWDYRQKFFTKGYAQISGEE